MAKISTSKIEASYVLATHYGVDKPSSMYGDALTACTGNGMTRGEMTVHIEDDRPYASQLADITAMRSAIIRSPLSKERMTYSFPSDELVLEYLAFDEAILLSEMDPGYESAILKTYPDMPSVLLEAVRNSTAIVAVMEKIDKDNSGLALRALREAPMELLQDLEADQAHQILQVLAIEALDFSTLGTLPERVQSIEVTEDNLVSVS